MKEQILWYAIMDRDDASSDWGDGTFDRSEALSKMHELNEAFEAEGFERTAYIAVIDANYEYAEGQGFIPTSDGICIEEITE